MGNIQRSHHDAFMRQTHEYSIRLANRANIHTNSNTKIKTNKDTDIGHRRRGRRESGRGGKDGQKDTQEPIQMSKACLSSRLPKRIWFTVLFSSCDDDDDDDDKLMNIICLHWPW